MIYCQDCLPGFINPLRDINLYDGYEPYHQTAYVDTNCLFILIQAPNGGVLHQTQ